MVVSVNIENSSIGDKILGMLELFSRDGVSYSIQDSSFVDDKVELSKDEILQNFKSGINELKAVRNGEKDLKSIEELLDEL